jgi:prophage tail gpP-like protein
MADFPVSIRFDGVRFDGWRTVSVSDSVDDLCVKLRLASVVSPGFGSDLGLTANSVIEVLADDELVTTVRLDMMRRHVSANAHDVTIEARSLARELVDCQYSVTLSGLTLGAIAKRLCETFKVPLQVPGKTALVPEFAMQSELPANALLNAARAANKLLYPTPDGGLLLTDPTDAAAVATLVYGEHFASYDLVDEHRLRFSDYVVKTFDYGGGRALKGTTKDEGITFFRPMHIIAERGGHDLAGCESRAALERNRRRARARRLELAIPAWGHAGGLWAINTQVRVVIPSEGIDEVLLVGERTLQLDAKGGRTAHLQLMPREAFLGEPKASKKRSVGSTRRGR